MNKNNLNDATKKKIDELVARVAKKAGYTSGDMEDFFESLGAGIEDAGRRFHHKHPHHRCRHPRHRPHHQHRCHKHAGQRDFAEEIRAYIADGIHDLMGEGHAEEDALRITMDKFDEAESKDDFKDFFADFDGFGIGKKIAVWHIENGVTLGLFYASSIVFGVTLGTLLGYLLGSDLATLGIGAAFGLFFGISIGLFSHAVLTLTGSFFRR
jgi:hypothetical protein